MREFNCIVCGAKAIDRSHTQNKKFCSRQCQWRYYNFKQGDGTETPCLYNIGVLCSNRKCDKCGWNPTVEKARKEKLYG